MDPQHFYKDVDVIVAPDGTCSIVFLNREAFDNLIEELYVAVNSPFGQAVIRSVHERFEYYGDENSVVISLGEALILATLAGNIKAGV